MAEIVGQVELLVVPNARNFDRSLQAIIDNAVKSAKLSTDALLNTDKFDVAAKQVQATAQATADNINNSFQAVTPTINTSEFTSAARVLQNVAQVAADQAQEMLSTITPEMETSEFAASARALASAAQAAAQTAQEALSGLNPDIDIDTLLNDLRGIEDAAINAGLVAKENLSGVAPQLDTSQFVAGADQLQEVAEQAGGAINSSFAKVATGIGVAAAAMYGIKAAGDAAINALAGVYDSLEKARAGFQAILGDTRGDAILEQIREFARLTPFAAEGLVQYSQQLLGVGRSAESIVPTLGAIGDLVASRGGDSQTINRVLFTLTQVQSVGRLIGQDALQLQSALIPITKLLADQLGKTQAEVKALMAAGKITADQVFGALVEAGGEVEGAMVAATKTITGAKEVLADTLQIAAQDSVFLKAIYDDIVQAYIKLGDYLGSDRINDIISGFSEAFLGLYESAKPVLEQFSKLSANTTVGLLEAVLPLLTAFSTILNSIPTPVLTTLVTFFTFSKFQSFITGFGKITSVMQNFGGALGGIGGGLGRATAALTTNQLKTNSAAVAQEQYTRALMATTSAAGAASLSVQRLTTAELAETNASLKASAAQGTKKPGRFSNKLSEKGTGRLVGGLAAAGIGASLLQDVVGAETGAGQALGIAGQAANFAAMGAAVGGPWGAALGAAAGAGFGIFNKFREDERKKAEADAEKWGKIGERSAEEFTKGFNKKYNPQSATYDAKGATLEQAEFLKNITIARQAAAGEIGVTPEVEAAFAALGIDLPKKTGPSFGDITGKNAKEFTQFGKLDDNQATAALAPFDAFATEREASQRKLVEFTTELAQITTNTELPALKQIVDLEKIRGFGIAASAEKFAASANNQKVMAAATAEAAARLQSFGINLDDTVLTTEQLSVYFNSILDDISAASAESTLWNNKLAEAKTTLEGMNKATLQQANAMLSLAKQDESYKKSILGLDQTSTSTDIAGLATTAFSNADAKAAQMGGDAVTLAANANMLFAASVKDIQEQLGLTDEQLKTYLDTVGLAGRYEIAQESQAERLKEIAAELNNVNSAAAADKLIKERDAINGVITAEDVLTNKRKQRDAQALPLLKQNEALQSTFAALTTDAIEGTLAVSKFGDAAASAYSMAAASGGTAAEINQRFVDSMDLLQASTGLTDAEMRDYLGTVGLLDTYTAAAEGSTAGLSGSFDSVADSLGVPTQKLRDMLGLISDIPNSATVYIDADTANAVAKIKDLKAQIDDLVMQATTRSDIPEQAIGSRRTQLESYERNVAAAGAAINATQGRGIITARENAEKAAKKGADEAKKAADAANKAAEEWAKKVEQAGDNIKSAIESAADAIKEAAEAWKGTLKERTDYERAVSAGRATRNAERQIKDINELTAGLAQLKARGVTEEVLKGLEIDGIEDVRQVRRLLRGSDSDLAKLNSTVATRDQLASQLAENRAQETARKTITEAIVVAAKILGYNVNEEQARQLIANFEINGATDADAVSNEILDKLSAGRISR